MEKEKPKIENVNEVFDLSLDAQQRQKILRQIENEKPRQPWANISDPVFPDRRTCTVPGCEQHFDNSSDYLLHMNASQQRHRELLELDFKRQARLRKAKANDPLHIMQRRAERGDEFREDPSIVKGETLRCPHCKKTFDR